MAGKATKKAFARKGVTKKAAAKKAAPRAKKAAPKPKKKIAKAAAKPKRGAKPGKAKSAGLDLSGFPAESLVTRTVGLCLACALDVLTRHLGLSAERAQAQIRRYSPTLEELSTTSLVRPFLELPSAACPYCGAPPKWHAPLTIVKIEGGKSTDTARRALVKRIGESGKFTILEEKSTERDALYSWLSNTGANLDLDSPGWLIEAARHWLGRRLPKEEWTEVFKQVRFVRRSRRLEDGFEIEGPRLFLAPVLFDEILLIQYLLSRSHKAGGQTFEGRLTLQDLFHRLRGGGYLRRMGIVAGNAADALEQLLEMQGGEGRVKFHYVIDRTGFLERLAELKEARIPRPK
jgi:hypothetical protein